MNKRSTLARASYRHAASMIFVIILAFGSSASTERLPAGSVFGDVAGLPALRAGAASPLSAATPLYFSEPAPSGPATLTFNITWQPGPGCSVPPAGAVAALDYAAGIWGAWLNSTIPVDVSACWISPVPCDGIACGKPEAYLLNFDQAPLVDTYYPSTLANALAARDLTTTTTDINVWFDASQTWSFATSGPPGSGLDFVSVALHELGHGLGYDGGMYESYNIGFCGTGPTYWYPCPTPYDRFVVDSLGVPLLSFLPSNPPALGARLKSDALFGGANTLASHGSAARLYTPLVWQQGSSLLHLDPTTFDGGPNALMTPNTGGAIRDPGPVTRAVLQDMGWLLGNGAANLTTSGPRALSVDTAGDFSAGFIWPAYAGQSLEYTWSASDQVSITHTLTALTDDLALDWDSPGLKTLVVTTSGGGVSASGTRSVLVFNVSASGATQGKTGKAYTFTASLLPDDTKLPVTYHWQASDQAPVTHTNLGALDTLAYTWTLSGPQTITVTASLGAASTQSVHTIQITRPVLHNPVYLPLINHAP